MAQHDAMENVRKIFNEWDTDKSGAISRENLQTVLSKISGGANFNVLALMAEIDTNGDGLIQYNEFIDWVMNTGAKTKMNSAGKHLSAFDFKSCLEPLFSVYAAGKGVITQEDFGECHTLIQGSLKLHPKECGSSDVALGVDDISSIFRKIRKEHDDVLTLDEFVAWQAQVMERSGIPNYDLKVVISKLAEVMNQILHIDQEVQHHGCDGRHEKKLMKAIESLAEHTRLVWEQRPEDDAGDEYEVDGHHYTNHWEDPPTGLSIERLKKFHFSRSPVRTYKLKSCEADVHMCVPQVPKEVDPERGRLWYAMVMRTTIFAGEDKAHEDAYYYSYEPKMLTWVSMPDPHVFYHAVETMAPELQLFALLKSEANMGTDIRWNGIQMALHDGVEMKLLTDAQLKKYNHYMMEFAHEMLVEGGHVDMEDMDNDMKAHAEKFLKEFSQMPRGVMAMLSELGFVKTSPVWKEFME